MIVSVGEALVDRIHPHDGHQAVTQVGGSPFNVAIALSRLGTSSGLVCPLSKDRHGTMLRSALEAENVAILAPHSVEQPTAVAEVYTDDNGHPRYVFHREHTADRAITYLDPSHVLPTDLIALHFGSLTLAQGADWPAWRRIVQDAKDRGVFIALDINVRRPLIDSMEHYIERVEEAISLSDLVKASTEDLELLWPHKSHETILEDWSARCRIPIITLGEDGAKARAAKGLVVHARAPHSTAPIMDTVGAGDTFQAACLVWLHLQAKVGAQLSSTDLQQMMHFACTAARKNCEHKGCNPPRLDELKPDC